MLTTGKPQACPVSIDNVDQAIDITEVVKAISVDIVNSIVDNTSERLLSGVDLAKRLGVNPGTLTRNRAKPNFTQWSQGKDPEQWAWQYVSQLEQYAPVLSTMSTND
jgi:hypothetical protein